MSKEEEEERRDTKRFAQRRVKKKKKEKKKSALRPLPNRSLVSHDLSSLGSTKPESREVPRGSQGVGYVRVN